MLVKNDKNDQTNNKEIPLSEFINAEMAATRNPSSLTRSDSVGSDVVIFLECCEGREGPYNPAKPYKETAAHIS